MDELTGYHPYEPFESSCSLPRNVSTEYSPLLPAIAINMKQKKFQYIRKLLKTQSTFTETLISTMYNLADPFI